MTRFYGLPMVPVPARERGRFGKHQEENMDTLGNGAYDQVDLCKRPGCDAPILWLKSTTTGRPAPIDALPSEHGNIVVDEQAGSYQVLGSAEDIDAAGDRELHVNHFVTCKNPPGTSRS